MSYQYEYPRAALTVDCVVFGRADDEFKVLLIRRARPPYAGSWALPGGFVELSETLEQAALRELEEETGLKLSHAEQLRAFYAVDRDPRERVIAIAFMAVVELAEHAPQGSDDASEAAWFDLDALPALAFDHAQILACAKQRFAERQRGTTTRA
jgi:8-oxo-dGTP diphosphatase